MYNASNRRLTSSHKDRGAGGGEVVVLNPTVFLNLFGHVLYVTLTKRGSFSLAN